jgi:16S rRNA (cytidine1402-2'-O)-methyltransferase
LLKLLQIENKSVFINLTANHQFNEKKIKSALQELEQRPNQNKQVFRANPYQEGIENNYGVLVTDAGTPGISDPGNLVIQLAQKLNLPYSVLPGANAITPAIVASGFVNKEFTFFGFLPTKKGRQKQWEIISCHPYPAVIYESVHRIPKFLEEAQIYLEPERKICICREISKAYEETIVTTVSALNKLEMKNKGEFVVVIGAS